MSEPYHLSIIKGHIRNTITIMFVQAMMQVEGVAESTMLIEIRGTCAILHLALQGVHGNVMCEACKNSIALLNR